MIQEWGLEAWGSNGGCDARVLVTDWVCKCGEKVKLVCVECRKKLSPLHMSSSELPHMMLLRVPSERRMKRRRRMKLTKACLRVLAVNEWISALKPAKIGSCPTYMFCGSSDDMQPIISRLDVHSLGLKKRKEKWWITAYYQFTHRIHSQTDNPRSRPQVRGSKKKGKTKKCSRIIPHQTLAWIDVGQLNFFQTSRLAHQGVRGGSHGLITDGVQNLWLQKRTPNKMPRWSK